jgi:tRNA G10  N-methylase Trm11
MLLTCAKFGAMAFGSDIDGRQLRGRGEARSVEPQGCD